LWRQSVLDNQLYSFSKKDFRMPLGVDSDGSVFTTRADNIPLLCWPDGRWCFEANLYMIELYHRGLSRTNNGGTLKTYASNISHLLRYCFLNRTDFMNLTDSQFTLFVKGLQGKIKNKTTSVKARNANTVINIARSSLDFLCCVARFYNQSDFIGDKGRIKAKQKSVTIRIPGRNNAITRSFWHHNSFPTPDSKIKVLPINAENIQKLRDAIHKISTSYFLKRRRQVMLMMLEVTGGRRGEIAALTVKSVMNANAMREPMLELITLKKRPHTMRNIPISRPDLDMLISFIEKQRRIIVKKTIGLSNDNGFVFLSETTGNPLQSQTFSQELYALANAASIEEKAHAHMFRHRFITKLFVTLIEQHAFENVDDFRRALLDTESIKQKVQQWTGHSQLSSLEIYIHLAFDEITHFKKSYDHHKFSRAIDSVRTQLVYIREEINNEMTLAESMVQFENLLASFESELDQLVSVKKC